MKTRSANVSKARSPTPTGNSMLELSISSLVLVLSLSGCSLQLERERALDGQPAAGGRIITPRTGTHNICDKVDSPKVDAFGIRERGDVVAASQIGGPQLAILGEPGQVELRVHWSRIGSVELPLREPSMALFALDDGKVLALKQAGDSPAVVYLEDGVFRTRWLVSYPLETSALSMLATAKVTGLRTQISNLVIHHDFDGHAGDKLRALARCFAPPPEGTKSAELSL